MAITIHCYEPLGTPRQATLQLDPTAKGFAVYAMQDSLSEDAKDLRSTILRRLGDNPPANSTLLMQMEIRSNRRGELPGLRVLKVGARVIIEVIRTDSRGRVTKGTDLRSGSRLEATLRDLRTIVFSLEVESDSIQSTKSAVGGSRPGGSQAVEGVFNMVWMVPTVAQTLAEPRTKIVTAIAQRLKKMGLSPAMIQPMLLMSGTVFAAGYLAFDQYSEAAGLKKDLDLANAQITQTQAARDQALKSEEICRVEKKAIATALNDVDTTRMIQAEIALATPLAQAMALELGGPKMANDDAMKWDAPALIGVKKLIVNQMASQRDPLSLATECLVFEDQLRQGLPTFVLAYHPSAEVLCPKDYLLVDGGVDRGGPWGISKRAADEFGAPVDLPDGALDVRLNPRWSSATLADGLRSVQEALLKADTGDRPPVAPSQLHLWTVALWDAYNRLPDSPDGVEANTAEDCVEDLVVQLRLASDTAEPGQPILPSIDLVAAGQVVRVSPSVGCPWPAEAIQAGARASLQAVTSLALVQMKVEETGAGGAEEKAE
jgi:hypothetical protein